MKALAGERARTSIDAANGAAAKQVGALKQVADGFSADPKWGQSLGQFEQELAQSGHTVGEGFDGCPLCERVVGMLPELIMQMQQQQAAQPQG